MAANGRYFEDFQIGEEWVAEPVTLSEADILEFAEKYDPQPFHTDHEAAGKSIFGGLIASGWHVQVASFKTVVDSGFMGDASMGSPGADELRYLKPVRPGDTLQTTLTVLEKRASRTRDDRGYVQVLYEIRNQNGETVITMRGNQIYGRRPKGA